MLIQKPLLSSGKVDNVEDICGFCRIKYYKI